MSYYITVQIVTPDKPPFSKGIDITAGPAEGPVIIEWLGDAVRRGLEPDSPVDVDIEIEDEGEMILRRIQKRPPRTEMPDKWKLGCLVLEASGGDWRTAEDRVLAYAQTIAKAALALKQEILS